MMIYKIFKRTVFFFLIGLSLNAQEYEKFNGAWNAIFVDHELSDKISLRSEFHFRTISFLGVWNQQIFRPSVTFNASKNIKWTAGYSYLKNFNADVTASPRVRLEHNFWEQLVYNTPLKNGLISSRLRLEHRFQEKLLLQEERSLREYDFGSRVRYRFTYQRPLNALDAKVPLSFVFFDEVFVFMNPSGIPFRFNFNWTFFGLKLQLSKKAVLTSGFQKNTLRLSEDRYSKTRLWINTLVLKL